MNIPDLLTELESVFPISPVPSARDFFDGERGNVDPELVELKGEIGGKEWRLVDPDSFRNTPFLYVATPHVFAYYLPAYLRAALLNPDTEHEDEFVDITTNTDEYFSRKYKALSPAQREIVFKTLQFIAKRRKPYDPGPPAAFLEWWKSFAADG
jgi:hypothetical protein